MKAKPTTTTKSVQVAFVAYGTMEDEMIEEDKVDEVKMDEINNTQGDSTTSYNNNKGSSNNQKAPIICQYNGKKDHNKIYCWDLPQVYIALTLDEDNHETWYLEMGAKNHIISDASQL